MGKYFNIFLRNDVISRLQSYVDDRNERRVILDLDLDPWTLEQAVSVLVDVGLDYELKDNELKDN